ncbi:diguanylate cyclase [Sphingomonas oleivorans]|uniref:Diguanylate cyclase n=1 Tax=Sphingomonas oleivorans TaxID=1735121 RepID=A0A2T5FZU4_9SPHN|nr:tetratricopeptide repeat protein [Sphingomonas oleivorans]PTQ12220.1 diguanylate cyclase [Sphingomonas oleivorans]
MRVAFGLMPLLVISTVAVAENPTVIVQRDDSKATIEQGANTEVEKLEREAIALIRAKRSAEALPILDAAIAAEDKSHADEKRQIFCSRAMIDALVYAAMGAKMKRDTLVLGPTWANVLFLKGFVLVDVGRAEDAKPFFDRAIELSPLNAQYLAELGEWNKSRKEWTQAFELFQRASDAAEFAPDDDMKNFEKRRALRGMGYVLIEQGKLDEAERFYRQCLKLDPSDSIAKAELAYIREQKAKLKTPTS